MVGCSDKLCFLQDHVDDWACVNCLPMEQMAPECTVKSTPHGPADNVIVPDTTGVF